MVCASFWWLSKWKLKSTKFCHFCSVSFIVAHNFALLGEKSPTKSITPVDLSCLGVARWERDMAARLPLKEFMRRNEMSPSHCFKDLKIPCGCPVTRRSRVLSCHNPSMVNGGGQNHPPSLTIIGAATPVVHHTPGDSLNFFWLGLRVPAADENVSAALCQNTQR